MFLLNVRCTRTERKSTFYFYPRPPHRAWFIIHPLYQHHHHHMHYQANTQTSPACCCRVHNLGRPFVPALLYTSLDYIISIIHHHYVSSTTTAIIAGKHQIHVLVQCVCLNNATKWYDLQLYPYVGYLVPLRVCSFVLNFARKKNVYQVLAKN